MDETELDKMLSDGISVSLDPSANNIIYHIQLDTKLILLKIISRKLDATLKINNWRNLLLLSLPQSKKSSRLSSLL